jgi:hypothetical protein
MTAKELAQKIINKEVDYSSANITAFMEQVKATDAYELYKQQLSTLPPLKGSEKQIKWASELRERFINSMVYELATRLIFLWEETLRDGLDELQEPYKTRFNNKVREAVSVSKATNAAYIIQEMRFTY